jgi:ATP-dependent RNA helicase SUPV3L1/SUV3
MQAARRTHRPRTETGRLTAVLGPTNTGKTHLAVERMLGHRTGMIGLPLRLLAREVYDRVAAARGTGQVALITGEERIVPDRPRYYVCTVESMPLDLSVEFLAIDEIQLAADPERGHVFTDRLLNARGLSETMFLGADTMARQIRRLVPDAEFIGRPRFSKLSWTGPRKITRLPSRSAVVAFSATEVYLLAELLRRFRGGAAVVMGALSPRTRNAQVALYQAGEVDYLVATDAIGMGLNMNVDHVAFAGLSKFDGRAPRDLRPNEIAQIAGRAGRHTRDGTFGTTLDAGEMDPQVVLAVEGHSFRPVEKLYWRNSRLDLSTVKGLVHTLETPPPHEDLIRPRESEDLSSLRALAQIPEVKAAAVGYDAVSLLWDVCRIPDFRKTVADVHIRLLAAIYGHLSKNGVLPDAWVGRLVDQLDRSDGDIDTLATRIAHIRTWNYIAHRPDWIADRRGLQARAGAIEDKLSDALHDRLTQRFVDRRTTILTRRMRQQEPLIAAVKRNGEVVVEGEYVGTMAGFDFLPDDAETWRNGRGLRAAVRTALDPEVRRMAGALATAPAEALSMDDAGTVHWQGAPVARLARGDGILAPLMRPLIGDLVPTGARHRIERRLQAWLRGHMRAVLAPLYLALEAPLSGSARGLVFHLGETLGTVARRSVGDLLDSLAPGDRKALARLGIRIGRETVFLMPMLKPRQVRFRALLWCVHEDRPVVLPDDGRVSLSHDASLPDRYYMAIGYKRLGPRALRADMLERLAADLRRRARGGPFEVEASLLNMAGCNGDSFDGVMRALGYRANGSDTDGPVLYAAPERRRGRPRRSSGRQRREAERRATSPFAALDALKKTRK